MIESREKETKLLRQDIFIISTFSNTTTHYECFLILFYFGQLLNFHGTELLWSSISEFSLNDHQATGFPSYLEN